MGTFALALAFAGNDLVNFIGVPPVSYTHLNNHIGCIKPELEDLARGFCEDGMILGEWISESAALILSLIHI